MKLLYILYSLLAGALFNMFIAGREKIKARFSAVMHSLGTPVRLMKRFAVTSAASLRKSTEHIKAASRHAAHMTLQKFRVAAVRRGISRLKMRWKSLTMVKDDPRRGNIRRFFGQLRERALIATQNMRRGIGHPKTWWKAIVTIRGDPGRGISHIKTWLKSLTIMKLGDPRHGISRIKAWWMSVITMRDNPRRGNVRVFGQFIPSVRIKINTLRRCISHPKEWWKSVITMRDDPRHGVSRIKAWWVSVTTMRDNPKRGIGHLKAWWKSLTIMKLGDPRHGVSRIKAWWVSVTTMKDAPRRGISHIKTWWKSITTMKLGDPRHGVSRIKAWWMSVITMRSGDPGRGHIRVSLIFHEIFGGLSSGGAGLGTPEKFSLRKFVSTLRQAGTSFKAAWPGIRILPNIRLLSAPITSVQLLMKTAANRARLMLHSVGQRTRAVGRLLLHLSMFPIRLVEGAKTSTKERQASFGARTMLSSWIFPHEDGNDLYIKQAYAVTETAKNIIII